MDRLFDEFGWDNDKKRAKRPRGTASGQGSGAQASLKNRPITHYGKINFSKSATVAAPATVHEAAANTSDQQTIGEYIESQVKSRTGFVPPLDMRPVSAMYVASNLLSTVIDAPACMLADAITVTTAASGSAAAGLGGIDEKRPRRRLTPELYAKIFRQLLVLERDGWPDATGKVDGFTGKVLRMTAGEVAAVKERWRVIDEWASEQGWRAPAGVSNAGEDAG